MKVGLSAASIAIIMSIPLVASPTTFIRVSIEQLVASPTAWDGKSVEVEGLASDRFENLGLYLNRSDYCSRATNRKAIYVRWRDVRGFRRADEGHRLVVRGVFRNENGVERPTPDGMRELAFSTGAAGPGPLDRAAIIKRLKGPGATCKP